MWHVFNSLNCGREACLETALKGKFTKHVSCFCRLWAALSGFSVGIGFDVVLLICSGRDTSNSYLVQCHELLLKSTLPVRDISLVELILVCKVSLNTRIRRWPSAANPLLTAVVPSCPLFINWIHIGTLQVTIHLKTDSNCSFCKLANRNYLTSIEGKVEVWSLNLALSLSCFLRARSQICTPAQLCNYGAIL